MNTADISFGFSDEGIEEIVLDSRKKMQHALFVPIIGEHSDGHDYIDMAIANGAVAVLSSRPIEAMQAKHPAVRFYQVPDTTKALQEIGYMERKKFHGTVIGVTGSVGKTTTRSMIATAIAAGKKVFQTAGNAIACVDMAVMTNIGIAHIEQLKTQENILREKLHILDGMREGGALYLNMDDAILSKLTLEEIHAFGIATEQTIELRFYEMKDYDLHLMVKGSHMLQNASAAMHIATTLGVEEAAAQHALENFSGLAGRGATFRTKEGVLVIDDAYNASPASMKAGLEALASLEGKRHIAVLADMLELGEKTLDYHREVGSYLATLPIDAVFLYGERAAAIGEGIRNAVAEPHKPLGDEAARSMPTIEYFTDLQELRNTLHAIACSGDVILFKGSNSMKLSEIVRDFKQEQA